MPELPEVETIRRDLDQALKGRKVIGVNVTDRRLLSEREELHLHRVVIGQIWQTIERIGKYLVVHLDNRYRLIFHLRMTGQLVLIGTEVKSPAARMTLTFDHELRLAFCDQ